ncbi:hypothetical protein BDB01DRAFT_774346 [Pilobolus umbonatus]|nr:hypothetical protein BDB01DRAFT_774346 [Pilobolus umbonatus]
MSLRKLLNSRTLLSRPPTLVHNKYNHPIIARYATRRNVPPPAPRSLRVPPLPVILVTFGFTCLSIGLYEYYTSDIQKYPVPIRKALRKALYYAQDKDIQLSLKYYNEALALALESPEMEKDGAPLTGIMIQLGTLQESLGRLPEARQTLILALRHLLGLENADRENKVSNEAIFKLDLQELPPTERKKAIGIAQKLGDMTKSMKRDEECEKWYVWSVEQLLAASSRPVSEYGDSNDVIFDQEHMPAWLTKTDISSALEALGSFYASRQKPELAIHLYLHALTLIGMKSCQSAVVMNNLAEAYVGIGQYEEAKIWGQRGLDLVQNPNTGKINNDGELCNETCGVLLFNMGTLFEQTRDRKKARLFFESAKQHGRDFKQTECIKEADRALKRIDFEEMRDSP